MDIDKNKFIKISNEGVKAASHIQCLIAKDSEAYISNVRLLIDVKEDDTFEYIKERIVDQ